MNKEDNKMARETQKEKIARLETELAQAINQRDAAIADALASNSKLNAKHDVSDSPMYQSLLLDREQWKRIAKNRQDQIKKNELRYDELLTMYKDLEQQLKGSQAMQADPENQQTAYKELQTEHERLKTEYETVKTLCERTLEAYNAIQNDYKALQVELQQIRTCSGAGDDAACVCAADPRGGRSGPARGEAGQGAACGQPRRGTDRRARHQRAGAGLPVCAVG